MSESDYLVKLKRNVTRMPKIITENQALARADKEIYDKKSGKNLTKIPISTTTSQTEDNNLTKHDILRDNNKTSCGSRDPCSTESETTTAIRMNPERILESTPITTNIRQISNDNTITTENIEQQIEQLAHFADRQEISHIASEAQQRWK